MAVTINAVEYIIDFGLFARQGAQSFRTTVDEGGDPFERSTADEQMWKRTGYDWHMGAGQDYWDRRQSDRARFRDSLGVDPFTNEGKLALYGGAVDRSEAGVLDMVVAGGYLYCLTAGTVRRAAAVGGAFSSVVGMLGSGHASITTDGNRVWVADATSIELIVGTGDATQYSDFDCHLVGYANGRLLGTDTAAKGTIYEIGSGGTATTLIWAHPNSAFVWKRIVHAPNGIYLVGDAGDKSEVYKITVADATGDLIPPFSAVEMVSGETIYDLVHYGGVFVAATSRGVRLLTIADAAGHLTYGKVIEFENTNGAQGIATRGEDVYVGWGGKTFTEADGTAHTASGVAHVKLTEFTETLVPKYAHGPSKRSASASDNVVAVAYYKGGIFWTVEGALWSDQATNPAAGYMEVGHVEYGVVDEDKRLVAAEVFHEPLAASTSVTVDIVNPAGTAAEVVTSTVTSATSKRTLISSQVDERWRVFLTLTPSGANGPVVDRWSIEGIPSPYHAEDIVFPVILKDMVEEEHNEMEIGVDVWADYQALKALAVSRAIVTVLIGSQTLKGFFYDLSLQAGAAYDWTEDGDFVQGTYMAFFRTVES
jgi:hypothetical protein